MNLYFLVWECEEYSMEAEWTHFVSDKEVIEYEQQIKIANDFMRGNESVPDEEKYNIEDIWLNTINEVDGYAIKLVKKEL